MNSVVFIYELLLGPHLPQFIHTFGVIPIFYTRAWQDDPLLLIMGIPSLIYVPFFAWRLVSCDQQYVVFVDIWRQC